MNWLTEKQKRKVLRALQLLVLLLAAAAVVSIPWLYELVVKLRLLHSFFLLSP